MWIFLLGFFLLLAATCFYLGWIQQTPYHGTQFRARGGFIMSMMFALCVVALLRMQSGATDRLQAAGIDPHPMIVEAMIPTIGYGTTEQIWVFELSIPGEEALGFYRDDSHLHGWDLYVDQPGFLEFEREGRRLHISGGGRKTLIVMIGPRADTTTNARPVAAED